MTSSKVAGGATPAITKRDIYQFNLQEARLLIQTALEQSPKFATTVSKALTIAKARRHAEARAPPPVDYQEIIIRHDHTVNTIYNMSPKRQRKQPSYSDILRVSVSKIERSVNEWSTVDVLASAFDALQSFVREVMDRDEGFVGDDWGKEEHTSLEILAAAMFKVGGLWKDKGFLEDSEDLKSTIEDWNDDYGGEGYFDELLSMLWPEDEEDEEDEEEEEEEEEKEEEIDYEDEDETSSWEHWYDECVSEEDESPRKKVKR